MHEYPITCEIIRIAEVYAKKEGARKITGIQLVVGDDSGYVGDAIEMYFEEIAKGTLCEGASLSITCMKPKLQCSQCKEYFIRQPFSFACPICGGEGIPTSIGKEFYVDFIQVKREGD